MNKNKKKRILFIGEGISLAHVVRPYVLAESLDTSLYEVHFATYNGFDKLVTNSSFTCHQLKTVTPDSFYGKLKKGKPLYSLELLKEQVKDDLQLFAQVKPDLVITDFRPSASLSTEIKGIPLIALSNGYWSPLTKMETPVPDHPMTNLFGKTLSKLTIKYLFPIVFSQQIKSFKKLRRKLSLKKLSSSFEAYNKANITAYMDLPELTPTDKLPENHVFLGPVLWEPKIELPKFGLNKNKKTVYLTLGSSGELSQIEGIIDGLIRQGLQVITTSKVKSQKNVFSASSLPGIKVAAIADIIICHGGSGTVYQGLQAGIPVIGICSNLDQQFAMSMVEKKEIGKSFLHKEAKPKIIVEACVDLLKNQNIENLTIIKSKLQNSNASENFSKIVTRLCPTSSNNSTSAKKSTGKPISKGMLYEKIG